MTEKIELTKQILKSAMCMSMLMRLHKSDDEIEIVGDTTHKIYFKSLNSDRDRHTIVDDAIELLIRAGYISIDISDESFEMTDEGEGFTKNIIDICVANTECIMNTESIVGEEQTETEDDLSYLSVKF